MACVLSDPMSSVSFMTANSADRRTWDDSQLISAVAKSNLCGGEIEVMACRHGRTRPLRDLGRIHPDRQAADRAFRLGYLSLHWSTSLVRPAAQAGGRHRLFLA